MLAPLKRFIWLTRSIPVTILQGRWHYHLHCTSGETDVQRKEATTQSHTTSLWDEGLEWEPVQPWVLTQSLSPHPHAAWLISEPPLLWTGVSVSGFKLYFSSSSFILW